MARKIKIDNAILKRRARKEEKRKIQFKSKRKFYLIVCEGVKTEPNYFESLKASLPKGVLELTNIDIDGTGKNTLSIIEETKKLRKRYEEKYLRKIDKSWAVFDKDSFPPKNFNNAINKGENSKPKVNCAWSNEAFELWYLLHFSYYNTGISRERYQELLEKEINKASNRTDFKYRKNSEEMFAILDKFGDQDFAIENAEKLENLYLDRSYAKHNPCTKVHHLIKELIDLADEYTSQEQV
ncbi:MULTISPECIES: RloB family protein [unclassified Aureispira]|uniref:RloB family protein n=1 Tax=unclassified Aureispira TaxID=2649989 RepID=UPI00069880CC|nr:MULTISPECIES: RloB family protein [unclassified Aureispira]WMX13592.1 RloB family protein [Aureispira sp. CCB-E]